MVSIRRADDWAFERIIDARIALIQRVSIRRADDWAFEHRVLCRLLNNGKVSIRRADDWAFELRSIPAWGWSSLKCFNPPGG